MGHEDIVWEEDAQFGSLAGAGAFRVRATVSALRSSCRLGSVGVSEADATRGVAPVIAGGTLGAMLFRGLLGPWRWIDRWARRLRVWSWSAALRPPR